jgi:hypothetical protein
MTFPTQGKIALPNRCIKLCSRKYGSPAKAIDDLVAL